MIVMKLAIVVTLLLFELLTPTIATTSLAADISPDKAEYRSTITGSEQHKFGYELSENKHFHHTTTDEDGVRLGCYGHVLEGKKYSTQYVADMRGYRPVFTNDLISVYPKSGGEKKASFIREFSEDEMLSKNIRFFFPDGCVSKKELENAASHVHTVLFPTPTTTTARTTTLRTTTPRTTTPTTPTTLRTTPTTLRTTPTTLRTTPTTTGTTTLRPTTQEPKCVCTCTVPTSCSTNY